MLKGILKAEKTTTRNMKTQKIKVSMVKANTQ